MFEHVHSVHLIGANGVGLSAVGKLFLAWGRKVSGSDLHGGVFSEELTQMGATIHLDHKPENVPANVDLVLYSSAVPIDNPEREMAAERGVVMMSYAEFLGELSKQFKTIAVTGTHGKSTTTAMIGMVLADAGLDPTVIVGSRVPGFEFGNLRVGKSDVLVLEACEYQANHLFLRPTIGVITNIEKDHIDFYRDLAHIVETMQEYSDHCSNLVVVNAFDPESQMLQIKNKEEFSYEDIDFELLVPGDYNRANAAAASVVASELGVPDDVVKKSLEKFPGIWRRFERLGEWHGAEVISDYGHHATAITVAIKATRELFPDRRLVHIFQPHQHARTRDLFDDFVSAIGKADLTIVAEIYGVAGRTGAHQISSKQIVDTVKDKFPGTEILYAEDLDAAENLVRDHAKEGDVLFFQGAGDIDEVARRFV